MERKTEAIEYNIVYIIQSPSSSLREKRLLLVIHLDLERNDWIAVVPQRATSPPLSLALVTEFHKLPDTSTNRYTISTFNQNYR